MSCDDDTIIEDGCHVFIRKQGVADKLLRLQRGNKQALEKGRKIDLDALIGSCYGRAFIMQKAQLIPVGDDETLPVVTRTNDTNDVEQFCGTDNRNILDKGRESQALSEDDIHRLKSEGVSGSSLISVIADNNTMFQQKTIYSQQKYLNLKVKKHGVLVFAVRPTIRSLAKFYFERDPEKIGFLCPIAVARILNASQVCYGRSVLVVENALGLLCASMVQQLGGSGRCIHLHTGTQGQSIPAFAAMNFTERYINTYYPVALHKFINVPQTNVRKRPLNDERVLVVESSVSPTPKVAKVDMEVNIEVDDESIEVVGADSTDSNDKVESVNLIEKITEVNLRRPLPGQQPKFPWEKELKQSRIEDAIRIIETNSLDAVIIAIWKYDPVSLVDAFVDKLAPSRPFIVYSPYLECVTECYRKLQKNESILSLTISDNFARRYQIMTDRTHPEMTQHLTFGYLLTGIKVKL